MGGFDNLRDDNVSNNNNDRGRFRIKGKPSGESQLLLPRPIRSRTDYNFFNYCAPCLKLSKVFIRCPECRQRIRTRSWHRSKTPIYKRIELRI